MAPDKIHRLDVLAKQLAETLMTAVLCTREMGEMVRTQLDSNLASRPRAGVMTNGSHHKERPLLDESTLSVFWKGKKLHLGHTRCFWLLARLARRSGQYVTHLDLLRDVWDDEELATATIRSLVRRLRIKLARGGMGELAAAIQGHNGRYILNL
jgi:DNA-binding response OmpR family regulator